MIHAQNPHTTRYCLPIAASWQQTGEPFRDSSLGLLLMYYSLHRLNLLFFKFLIILCENSWSVKGFSPASVTHFACICYPSVTVWPEG